MSAQAGALGLKKKDICGKYYKAHKEAYLGAARQLLTRDLRDSPYRKLGEIAWTAANRDKLSIQREKPMVNDFAIGPRSERHQDWVRFQQEQKGVASDNPQFARSWKQFQKRWIDDERIIMVLQPNHEDFDVYAWTAQPPSEGVQPLAAKPVPGQQARYHQARPEILRQILWILAFPLILRECALCLVRDEGICHAALYFNLREAGKHFVIKAEMQLQVYDPNHAGLINRKEWLGYGKHPEPLEEPFEKHRWKLDEPATMPSSSATHRQNRSLPPGPASGPPVNRAGKQSRGKLVRNWLGQCFGA